MGLVYYCDRCGGEIRPYDKDMLEQSQPCRACLVAEIGRLRHRIAESIKLLENQSQPLEKE